MDTIIELDQKLDETHFSDLFDMLIEKTNFLESIKDDEDEDERKENIDEFKSEYPIDTDVLDNLASWIRESYS